MTSTDPILQYTQIISAASTVILAIITGYYAITTNKILKESKKDRRISLINNQLNNFYYPLHYLLNWMIVETDSDAARRNIQITESIDSLSKMTNNVFFISIMKNRGFALNTETKCSLDSFLEIIHKNHCRLKTIDMQLKYDDIRTKVEKDIEELTKQLEELIKQ